MHEGPVGRRQVLRWSAWTLLGLGLATSTLGGLASPRRVGAQATDPASDTTYRATGIYEQSAPNKETLVALVLVPVDEDPGPSIQMDRALEWRDLGTGPLQAFQRQAAGMEQIRILTHGRLEAVVYSLRTGDGSFLEKRQYWFGPSTLSFEDPHTRRARSELGDGK
jgi:hypothetical protein